jgi:guanine deaminase
MSETELKKYFLESFKEARTGIRLKHGGPFGAVVVKNGKIIGKGHNMVLKNNDPSAHAEVTAIRNASKKLKSPHLKGCVLIASSEPCPMCLTTSYWAQIKEIYYCVPKEVAEKVGFSDSFIYRDLKKTPSKRSVKVSGVKFFADEGIGVFYEWQKLNGKLY